MKRAYSVTVGTVSAILAAAPGHAADVTDIPPTYVGLPAVSGPNAKLGIAGGAIDLDTRDSDGRVHGEFSYTAPLGYSTGFQFDGAIGAMGSDTTVNADGHLFFRDPATHLLGVWGGFASIGSNDIGRFGPEVEVYFDRFTVQGTLGWENSDSNGDEVFAHANLAYYLHDDLQIYGGFRRTLDRNAAALGFEKLLDSSHGFGTPISLFAEGQVGEDDHATVWAGMRFYLHSQDKSLIRRHREDDPIAIGTGLNWLAAGVEAEAAAPCIVDPMFMDYVGEDGLEFDNCGNPLDKMKMKTLTKDR